MLRVLLAIMLISVGAAFLACGDDDTDGEPTATTEPIETGPTETAEPTEAEASPTEASPDDETPTPTQTEPRETNIRATLSEYEIELDVNFAPEGEITFAISVEGPEESHQLMVVDTDLAPDDLPTNDAGVFDPAGGGAVIIANTVGLSPGTNDLLGVDLEAGSYVLICNFVNPEGEGHYGQGMRTGFTVE